MGIPNLSDLIFDGIAKIKGLPAAAASGEAVNFEQLARVYRSGSDYTIANNQLTPSTGALTANTIRAYPWRVTKKIIITAVRCEVTTLVAGATFRLGLYTDNNGYPNALVAGSDVATLDGATLGVRLNTFASAITLLPGIYWLAVNSSAAPTLRAILPASIESILGVNPAGGATSQYTGWTVGATFAALPATYPAAAALNQNSSAPMAMFRIQ
jgi:hypothetical protein